MWQSCLDKMKNRAIIDSGVKKWKNNLRSYLNK